MMSKKMIRVICIIMAVLMVLSVGAVVLQVVAVDENVYQSFVNPATGDSGSDYYVPAGIAVAAVLAVVLCLVLPKMKKSDTGSAASGKNTPKAKHVGKVVNKTGNSKTDKN